MSIAPWLITIFLAAATLPKFADAQEAEPKRWEELFFPFPIVGAPPQLEQQVQIFGSSYTGNQEHGWVPSLELAWIATPHFGLVATIPYQSGHGGQPTGLGDLTLIGQYLTAGSLDEDWMISTGVQATIPTGAEGVSAGDLYLGPLFYGAKRFSRHLVFELNLTPLFPVEHETTSKQFLANALVSYLLTPVHSEFPVYAQAELNSTFYFAGSAGGTHTVFLAPELFFGPFKTPISDGTRIAAGVFFNLTGDPAHQTTYALTAAFDIPNRFGY